MAKHWREKVREESVTIMTPQRFSSWINSESMLNDQHHSSGYPPKKSKTNTNS